MTLQKLGPHEEKLSYSERRKRTGFSIAGLAVFLVVIAVNASYDVSRPAPGETGCKKAIETSEEFPSTVDYTWFGTESQRQQSGYMVTVDYSARNSTGASLPWRMTCYSDNLGNLISSSRAGR